MYVVHDDDQMYVHNSTAQEHLTTFYYKLMKQMRIPLAQLL